MQYDTCGPLSRRQMEREEMFSDLIFISQISILRPPSDERETTSRLRDILLHGFLFRCSSVLMIASANLPVVCRLRLDLRHPDGGQFGLCSLRGIVIKKSRTCETSFQSQRHRVSVLLVDGRAEIRVGPTSSFCQFSDGTERIMFEFCTIYFVFMTQQRGSGPVAISNVSFCRLKSV